MNKEPVQNRPLFIPALGIILEILSIVFVTVRIYVCRKRLKAGDVLLLLGWVVGTALTMLAIHDISTHNYASRIGDLSSTDRVHFAYITRVFEILYLIALPCIKISLLAYYHALAYQLNRSSVLWAIRACIILTSTYMLVFLVLAFTGCRPFESYWKSLDPSYTQSYVCVDGVVVASAVSIFSSIVDFSAFAILVLMTYMWETQPRPRAGLFVLFFIGVLVIVFGIMRIVLVDGLAHAVEQQLTRTWELIMHATIWQVHLTIICACAPIVYGPSKAIVPQVESFFQNLRFMRGQNLNATKRLDSRASDRSHRAKQNSPTSNGILISKAENVQGKEKVLPPAPAIDVEKHSNNDTNREGSIMVAFRVDRSDELLPDMGLQSPTLPPESKWRLSGMSFSTSGGFSRWSGIRTPRTAILRSERSGQTSPLTPASPSRSMNFPRSPGLSQIDVHEDIPEVPPMPDLAHLDHALESGYVACRGCGQYHPYGYRHGQAQSAQISRFNLWRKVSNGRARPASPRPSTFFNDQDDDDDELPVV